MSQLICACLCVVSLVSTALLLFYGLTLQPSFESLELAVDLPWGCEQLLIQTEQLAVVSEGLKSYQQRDLLQLLSHAAAYSDWSTAQRAEFLQRTTDVLSGQEWYAKDCVLLNCSCS